MKKPFRCSCTTLPGCADANREGSPHALHSSLHACEEAHDVFVGTDNKGQVLWLNPITQLCDGVVLSRAHTTS